MASNTSDDVHFQLNRRWAEYAVKVAVLVAVFWFIANFAPAMPPLCLAIVWAILSFASAIGFAYHYVIGKVRNRASLEDGGIAAKLNNGRVFSLTIAFVASALLIGGLIFELPKWETAEWAMLILAIPLYIGFFKLAGKRADRELKPLFRVSGTIFVSNIMLFAALLIVYLIICLYEPNVHYETMTEALLGTKQPFEKSSSALLADLGYLNALVDGLTAFAMTRVAKGSFAMYIVWRIITCGSVAIGLANLIGICALKLDELKLVFQPLSAVDNPRGTTPLLKPYIALGCILPLVLVACSITANAKVSEIASTGEYTMIKAAIREQVGMAACVIDGKRYDYEKVRDLVDSVRTLSDDLAAEREAVLTPLINDTYDKRLANVDAYLDWYYSLPADYDRLLQFFGGTVEDGMKEQLAERINEGIDETALDEALNYYWEQSLELESSVQTELAQYELSDYDLEDIPEWLIKPTKTLKSDVLTEPLEPTKKFLDAGERAGLSAGTGAIAGVIAKSATEKILAKPFFAKIVASLVEKLGARGLLAAGGTALLPGIGTALGIGIGLAGDYLFLKADEAMNRDSYREEIVSAIEESRAEMLEMVKA